MISSELDDKTTAALDEYAPLIGRARVIQLHALARSLRGLRIEIVGSLRDAEAAETHRRVAALLAELGLDASWEAVEEDSAGAAMIDVLSAGLRGRPLAPSPAMWTGWEAMIERNSHGLSLDADCVIAHGLAAIGLIRARRPGRPVWLWRCDRDLSAPDPSAWHVIEPYATQYDAVALSTPLSARSAWPVPQYLVRPSIDPFSERNRDLSRSFIRQVLRRFGIEEGRPIILQMAPFGALGDPAAVLAAYRLVRKTHRCQLVFAGLDGETDSEGARAVTVLRQAALHDPDLHLIDLPTAGDLEINALQRASTIILHVAAERQSPTTLIEALFKKKPVVAGSQDGITLPVVHGVTGLLTQSVEGAAYHVATLLDHPDLARRLGQQGGRHVCDQFLLTREVLDLLLVLLEMRARTSGRKPIILQDGTGRR